MANIRDVYSITSKASLAGVKAAQKAVTAVGHATTAMGKRARAAGTAVSSLAGKMTGLRKAAGFAVRGIGGLAKGLAGLAAGGLLAVVGGIQILPGLFEAMRNATEDASDAVSGAGGSLEEAAEAADAAQQSFGDAADSAEESAQRVRGVFGAWGDVGAGFIMRAGRVYEDAKETAKAAATTAAAAAKGLSEAKEGLGEATQSTSTFGQALDRLGAAWTRVKNVFLQAIAKALIPLLEALADMLEDPRFIRFVEMLAEDVAEAIGVAVEWIVEELIPAILELLEEIEEAGGLFEWLRKKFDELKDRLTRTLLQLAGIVIGTLVKMRRDWQNNFDQIGRIVHLVMDRIWDKVRSSVDNIKYHAETLGAALRAPWEGLGEFVEGVWDDVRLAIGNKINSVIRYLNGLIRTFNRTIARLPGISPIRELEPITLARGGIVNSPVLAVVGDNPRSPEVVAPLHELVTMMRQALGGMGPRVAVNVTVAPGGFATPEEAGERAGAAFVRAARARGIRL